MKLKLSGCVLALVASVLSFAMTEAVANTLGRVASPDGAIRVEIVANDAGELRYTVKRHETLIIGESKLGVVCEDADFSRGLKLLREERTREVQDEYEILTAKRRVNTYRANRKVLHVESANGRAMEVVFQVSNDGVAFRYRWPSAEETAVRKVLEEITSFQFSPETRAWLQPMSVAKTGWSRTNPSYEEHYEKDIPVGTPPKLGAGWVYPALFRTGETWVVISEADLGRGYCGTRLRTASPKGEYTIGFPDEREGLGNGPVKPEGATESPWRVIVIGDLATVTESMLGVDLASPAKVLAKAEQSKIVPGKAAWSWPLLGDGKTVYDVQKQFIDYAAEMTWRYCLIDALWDQQIGYENVKELAEYAATKDVKLLLWYNSRGDWNDAPQTPRDRMLTRESRREEFERLVAMGIAGVKIDFFGGDGQSQIEYYLDILEDAAPYGLLINFHGCTLPRGWQRTYPHLMTMEAIKGLEFITFEQANADEAPMHATMLPFTRNLFDPMDFTPVVLDRINNIERRTSSAFELALSVLFTSGIQHYAEIPDGMAKAPEYVRAFLRDVPGVWDDVVFLDGYPGKFVAIARKAGGRWYVAGINGETTEQKLSFDLTRLKLGQRAKGMLITDGDTPGNLSFAQREVAVVSGEKLPLTLAPRGGVVLVIE
jgi:Glycoside hydrolase 97.